MLSPRPGADAVEVAALAVEAVGELLVHHRALGEREVLHVARQPDQHRPAGLGVDAGDRHRVRAAGPSGRRRSRRRAAARCSGRGGRRTPSPSPNIVRMKSRCTPTRWAPKSSVPATVKHSTPLTPTTARRWLSAAASAAARDARRRRRGSAQPTASAISASRSSRSSARCRGQPEDEPCQTRPATMRQQPRAPRAPARSAARSGRPAGCRPTSWAEPGTTRVISISAIGAAEAHACGAVAGGGARQG